MWKLFFLPVCPISNRIVILTKFLNYEISLIPIYKQSKLKTLVYNDIYTSIPCLSLNDIYLFGSDLITKYLYENNPNNEILKTWHDNKSISHFDNWMTNYIYNNVFIPLYFDKHIKDFFDYDYNISFEVIKNAQFQLINLLNYVNNNVMNSGWINGNSISVNDITCFSFFATMDYCAYINWNKFIHLKQWYMRMKSLETYSCILKYNLTHMKPVSHYNCLDF